MKKRGILHAQLISCIAALGHKDTYMIGDAGMPIPPGVQVIDLAVTAGVPTFRQVMDAVLEEAVVEGYTLADEIMENNPELLQYIKEKPSCFPLLPESVNPRRQNCGGDTGAAELSMETVLF